MGILRALAGSLIGGGQPQAAPPDHGQVGSDGTEAGSDGTEVGWDGTGLGSDSGGVQSLADRLVQITNRALGEDIDGKLDLVLPPDDASSYDAFGVDRATARVSLALVAYLHRWYFRTEVHGVDNVPDGRVLLVSNHSGQIPLDGVLITASLVLDSQRPRVARNTVARFVGKLPFISTWYARVWQVLGAPENARMLLERGEPLVAFPEGVEGVTKTFDQRYQLAPFGPGFMRLALETQSPIVPVAVIGAEEQLISVANWKTLGGLVGLPAFPVLPQLLFGMVLPLPTKYRIYFGEPMPFSGHPDDDATIEPKVREVRNTIQAMVNKGLKERKAIFW